MLELTKGNTGEKIIVTLTEKVTLDEPNYLFIFVHGTTKEVIALVRLNSDDESDYQSRYNKFDINTSVTFLNKSVGEWLYQVYEQANAVNVDPDLSGALIESGKMILYPAAADVFEQTIYDEPTTYKAYQG